MTDSRVFVYDEIVLDRQNGVILLDGVPLPCAVEENINVEVSNSGTIVRIGLVARNVKVIDS